MTGGMLWRIRMFAACAVFLAFAYAGVSELGRSGLILAALGAPLGYAVAVNLAIPYQYRAMTERKRLGRAREYWNWKVVAGAMFGMFVLPGLVERFGVDAKAALATLLVSGVATMCLAMGLSERLVRAAGEPPCERETHLDPSPKQGSHPGQENSRKKQHRQKR